MGRKQPNPPPKGPKPKPPPAPPKKNPIQAFFDSYEDNVEISYIDERCIVFGWSAKGHGFGEYTFFKKDDKWKLDSERDGKEAVMRAICHWINSIELVD